MKTVAFHTLGCKVNQYDTQAMLERFSSAGYQVVPFEETADVYVLNTCTVTGTGDKKSMQIARRLRREHPCSDLILCGCLAQRKGEELLSCGARLIIGTQRRGQVVELLEKAVAQDIQLCAVDTLTSATPFETLAITNQDEHTRAVMKIQEGCNNHCTYCIIPSVRGPIRSRKLNEIRDEAGKLAEAGFQQIVLTGIHLTSYGKDLKDGSGLIDAIRILQETAGIRRIRLGSLEPNIAFDTFADELAQMDKICPQFHLALQSGSDTILARMARRYNTKMYRDAAEKIYHSFPMAALTTDVLTGFPGETEQEFEETCDFVREMGYARIHVFPYSRREGTKAANMPGQLSREAKEQRARRLIEIGDEVSRAYRQKWIGREADVLAEEAENGVLTGYTREYIKVDLPGVPACMQGKILRVRLEQLTEEGMTGVPV